MTDLPDQIFGMRVITTPALPLVPTIEQEAKWIVQQGFRKAYSDFTQWYPATLVRKPEITHAIIMDSPPYGKMLAISPHAYRVIRMGVDWDGHYTRDPETVKVIDDIWDARNYYLFNGGR